MSSIYDKSSLVLIPSGTKTGKVFSQKPVSGDGDFTFTRSSAATRVNADGNIEKETQNKLLYSNQPNQWSVVSVSLTGGQAGYDGSNDAWLFDSSAGYIRNNLSLSGVYTYSIYAKQGTANGIRLRMDAGTDANVYINLTDGSESFSPSGIDYTATSVGGGWWRISVTQNDSSFSNFRVYAIDASGGSTTGTIYIQDAQINQGLVAQPYQETIASAVYGGITDNTPRLDYTDSSCPALLLEPLRTNLVPHSEYFGAWNKSTGAITITSNYGVSPEGLQNSSRVQFTSASQHINISTSLGTGVTSTGSVYIKGTAGETIQFDTGGAGALKTLTGDWQRIEVTSTSVSSLLLINTFGGATARDIEVWGAQCEQASYATSYIPTYGSSVSRVADACNTLNVEELIGQTEGTIFYQGLVEKATGNDGHAIAFTQDANGNGSSRFLLYRSNSTGNMKVYFQNTSGVAFGQATLPIPTSSNDKYAIAYSTNDLAIYVNGVLEHTQSVGVIPTTKFVNINRWTGNMKHKNECRNVLLFQTRLSNEELAALTTI